MSNQAVGVLPGGVCTTGAAPQASWGGVFAISLCVFSLVASEFMPVSLLTPMAADFHISEGRAGQGLAMSGAFAVLMSLSISTLARGVDRKKLLLSLTVLMCLSSGMVVLAPNFMTYMVGRALIGMAIGGFWSMSASTAMELVPRDQVPRALAVFNGGNALATVIAAPLGSYLASFVGWRGAFFFLVPIAMVALVWQWRSLPAMRPQSDGRASGHVLALLGSKVVALGMLAVGFFFMGQFTLFTYLRPFLERVTLVDVSTLSLMLLVVGVAGFVGTLAISGFLKNSLYRTLAVIPIVMSATALLLVVAGSSVSAVAVLLGLWGLLSTAAPVGWWTWVARTLPDHAEAGGGLMVAVVQLAITLGATVGGLLFDGLGYQGTFAAAAAFLLISALLVSLTARTIRTPAV